MARDGFVRVEIGLDGGQILSMLVTAESADALERALDKGDSGALALEAQDGELRLVLSRVLYAKRFARECTRRLRRLGDGRAAPGRDRRPAERGQDDPLQRAHARGRGGHRLRVRGREGERRDGGDPRRAARAGSRQLVGSRKVTPAAIRVVDVPGPSADAPGGLRQADALLAVLDGFSDGADPERRPRDLALELLVADRDHVARRLEKVRKDAKSGDPGSRKEAELSRSCSPTSRRESRSRTWRASFRPRSSR